MNMIYVDESILKICMKINEKEFLRNWIVNCMDKWMLMNLGCL
jgi:hypothetical protein